MGSGRATRPLSPAGIAPEPSEPPDDEPAAQERVEFDIDESRQPMALAQPLLSGILESAVEYGYLTSNSAGGVKFPLKGLRAKPAMSAGDSLAKLLAALGQYDRLREGDVKNRVDSSSVIAGSGRTNAAFSAE